MDQRHNSKQVISGSRLFYNINRYILAGESVDAKRDMAKLESDGYGGEGKKIKQR